jgi:hypothetical protein
VPPVSSPITSPPPNCANASDGGHGPRAIIGVGRARGASGTDERLDALWVRRYYQKAHRKRESRHEDNIQIPLAIPFL